MLLKVQGRILRVNGEATMEDLKKRLNKPHLCKTCGTKVCIGDRHLESAIIENAAKAIDGLYVIDCITYTEDEEKTKINIQGEDREYFSSPTECSVIHPTVKHLFIR